MAPKAIVTLLLMLSSICLGEPKAARKKSMSFIATAYAAKGETASGTLSRVGTVAADPAVLPIGSRIHVSVAGYPDIDGTYLVADTGSAVKGRHIDIRLPSQAQAKRFGKRRATVRVLEVGQGKNDPKLPKLAAK